MTKPQQNIKLKCPRCGNVWTYQGRNTYFAPCSYCKTSVKVDTNKVI